MSKGDGSLSAPAVMVVPLVNPEVPAPKTIRLGIPGNPDPTRIGVMTLVTSSFLEGIAPSEICGTSADFIAECMADICVPISVIHVYSLLYACWKSFGGGMDGVGTSAHDSSKIHDLSSVFDGNL